MNSSVQAPGPMLENPSPHYTQEHTHTVPSGPLTSPTGHLRWRWTLLPFIAPPKTEKNTSQSHPAASVSMQAPLNNKFTYIKQIWEARFKDRCLPHLPRGKVLSGPEGTGLLIGHVRSNRPWGPEWHPCTCTTPGQPQYAERARRRNYSSRRGDRKGQHATSSWPRQVRARSVFLDTWDKVCLQAYSESHQRFSGPLALAWDAGTRAFWSGPFPCYA